VGLRLAAHRQMAAAARAEVVEVQDRKPWKPPSPLPWYQCQLMLYEPSPRIALLLPL
jgi:hypothetical protein